MRGRAPGRGVYLCSLACAARALKNKRYPGLGMRARTEAEGFATLRAPCMIGEFPAPESAGESDENDAAHLAGATYMN
ncbi:MAG: hypothetical protein NVS2B3_13000 [Vulcanimicrobiaceae bacterium]